MSSGMPGAGRRIGSFIPHTTSRSRTRPRACAREGIVCAVPASSQTSPEGARGPRGWFHSRGPPPRGFEGVPLIVTVSRDSPRHGRAHCLGNQKVRGFEGEKVGESEANIGCRRIQRSNPLTFQPSAVHSPSRSLISPIAFRESSTNSSSGMPIFSHSRMFSRFTEAAKAFSFMRFTTDFAFTEAIFLSG